MRVSPGAVADTGYLFGDQTHEHSCGVMCEMDIAVAVCVLVYRYLSRQLLLAIGSMKH